MHPAAPARVADRGAGEVLFNTAGAAPCAGGGTKIAGSTSAVTKVTVGVALAAGTGKMARGANSTFCQNNKVGVLKEFAVRQLRHHFGPFLADFHAL